MEQGAQGVQKRRGAKYVVPLVLAIGLVAGWLLSLLGEGGLDRFTNHRVVIFFTGGPEQLGYLPLVGFHVILSTVAVALLISLVVVYANVYRQTRANFALGLIVVLVSLLLHSILSHPFVLALTGPLQLGPEFFLPPADILTVIAYAVFLYLSLE